MAAWRLVVNKFEEQKTKVHPTLVGRLPESCHWVKERETETAKSRDMTQTLQEAHTPVLAGFALVRTKGNYVLDSGDSN